MKNDRSPQDGGNMAKIFLAVGSNLPFQRLAGQDLVLAGLRKVAQRLSKPLQVSPLYESEPVPKSDQPNYVNGVACLEADIGAEDMLACLLDVEQDFGRYRSQPNAARTLDLDLLAVGQAVVHLPGLIVPHPRMQDRGFVMQPLSDLCPNWRHPESGRRAADILADLDTRDLVRITDAQTLVP